MQIISTQNLDHLIATYGYLAVFIGVALESMGVPFPGETTLLLASIYAGSTHKLSIVLIIATAAAAAIIGDNIGFWVGREGGFRLVRRFGHVARISERKMKLGQYLFMRHGGKVVFFGRFVSILRTWAAFLAGTNRMRWPKFLFFNGMGGIIWATIYGVGGYFLGTNVYRIKGPVGIAVAVAAVVVLVILFFILKKNEHRLEAEAVRALPGPIDHYYGGTPREERKE